MSLYQSFTPNEHNTAQCAAATFELSALPGVGFVLSVLNLQLGQRTNLAGHLSVKGLNEEYTFKLSRWQSLSRPDCEQELLAVLAHPDFGAHLLQPLARKVAHRLGRPLASFSTVARKPRA